jgi:hypothetical protein
MDARENFENKEDLHRPEGDIGKDGSDRGKIEDLARKAHENLQDKYGRFQDDETKPEIDSDTKPKDESPEKAETPKGSIDSKDDQEESENIPDYVTPEKITPEMAYLAGTAEDAHLGKGGKEGYVYDIESKSPRWLEEGVKPAMEDVLPEGKPVDVKQRGTRPEYRMQVYDKDLVEAAQAVKGNPEIVKDWDDESKRAWVRGLADAEGSATMGGSGQPQFSIYNQDFEKLQVAADILEENGIHSGFYCPQDRDVWQMFLTGRDNLEQFQNEIGLNHPEKREKLQGLLET